VSCSNFLPSIFSFLLLEETAKSIGDKFWIMLWQRNEHAVTSTIKKILSQPVDILSEIDSIA
jgi:hypothetical protein